jgi:hypothetical protein
MIRVVFLVLALSGCATHVADTATTLHGVTTPGFIELNPVGVLTIPGKLAAEGIARYGVESPATCRAILTSSRTGSMIGASIGAASILLAAAPPLAIIVGTGATVSLHQKISEAAIKDCYGEMKEVLINVPIGTHPDRIQELVDISPKGSRWEMPTPDLLILQTGEKVSVEHWIKMHNLPWKVVELAI